MSQSDSDDDCSDFSAAFVPLADTGSAPSSEDSDLARLIERLGADAEHFQLDMAALLETLSRAALDRDGMADARRHVGAVARSIAEAYAASSALPAEEGRKLSRLWRVQAARLGDFRALYELAGAHEAKAATTALSAATSGNVDDNPWLAPAFTAALAQLAAARPGDFGHGVPAEEVGKRVGQAAELIRWQQARCAVRARQWLLQLLQTLEAARLLDSAEHRKRVQGLRAELAPSQGLWALDHITPSNDRAVKSTLEEYQPLCETPVDLAPVPDLAALKAPLDAEFPWFAEITRWILRQLTLRSGGTQGFRVEPLLLLGEPGVGKTAYFQRLAELAGVPYLLLGLAGKTDNRDLAGTARGWSNGHPSRAIALIRERAIGNPLILLDELDKAGGSDRNGRVADTLLGLLEPSSSRRCYDDYLWGHADLSRVSWIATANDISQMPRTLLSRIQVKRVSGPRREHYPAIVRRAARRYLAQEELHPGWLPDFTRAEWAWLGRYFSSPRMARRATELLIQQRLAAESTERRLCH